MRRGSSGLCGILAVDKPSGMTSHDVVNRVRSMTGERRVGHAGTLDPMATGLMLVAVGAATRLSNYLTAHDKSYRARFVFGVATDTDDTEGRVVSLYSDSEPGHGVDVLDEIDPDATICGLVGTISQLPPAYSAIKKNGVAAYKAAREGTHIELSPRDVTVYGASLVGTGQADADLDDGQGGRFRARLPYWDVDLRVSKGTYIRSIARDLGQQLGCGAHLGALRRTAVADLGVDEAHTLDELERLASSGRGLPWCDPTSLLGFPVLSLTDEQVDDVSNGRELAFARGRLASCVSCVHAGRLLAVYRGEHGHLKPATVIPGGVVGVC